MTEYSYTVSLNLGSRNNQDNIQIPYDMINHVMKNFQEQNIPLPTRFIFEPLGDTSKVIVANLVHSLAAEGSALRGRKDPHNPYYGLRLALRRALNLYVERYRKTQDSPELALAS
jgi:hypothetical protein